MTFKNVSRPNYYDYYRCRKHGWYTHEECTDEHGEISWPYTYPDGRKCRLTMRTTPRFSNHGPPRPRLAAEAIIQITTP